VTRQSIGGEKRDRAWRRESRLLERPRDSSLIATAAGAGKRAGSIPERSSGWRPDACRSCRPVGLTGHFLGRPSPPPPYRACRPNVCRYGSRGKPHAANDVAHLESAADVELVLSDEVGHIDRVIAGADVIRVEDSASGAAQSCGARRLTFAREGAPTRTKARVDRSISSLLSCSPRRAQRRWQREWVL
jgi:hypothetical protein